MMNEFLIQAEELLPDFFREGTSLAALDSAGEMRLISEFVSSDICIPFEL